jgi:ubiquinone/menaquinone biosynthesis C-methylase UbiE
MGIYSSVVLPRLINLAMQTAAMDRERARWIPLAIGRVIEVGFGSGLSLRHYSADVARLDAVDPSRELWNLATRRCAQSRVQVTFTPGSAEALSFEDGVFDTAVVMWTLCSIPDPTRALHEIRRVLRPDGRLIFVEHGRAPEASTRRWQSRITPIWKRIAGGCELGRDIAGLLTDAGFEFGTLETGYSEGPRPFAFLYKGVAKQHARRGEVDGPAF